MNIANLVHLINYNTFLQVGTPNSTSTTTTTVDSGTRFISDLWSYLPNVLGAIGILIVGWLVAIIVSSAVGGLLKNTSFDNRIATWLSGRQGVDNSIPIEKWISTVVFWVIFLFGLIAFLNALQLTAVSAPLNSFLNQIFVYLPRIVSAAVTLGIAWLLATLAKTIVIQGLGRFNLDERVARQTGDGTTSSSFSLNETFGNALYWFILLFFLPLILDILQLQGPLQPVQNLLNQILLAVPKILTAILIGAIGWFLARIVRMLVTNFLTAVGINGIGSKIGLNRVRGGLNLAELLGTVVYVLILIPTTIAALQSLQIEAISTPAVLMLTQILNALPKIFTAALILAISYAIGHFVADLATGILTSIGFNDVFTWLGVATDAPPTTTRRPTTLETPPLPPEDFALGSSSTPTIPKQTPSEIVGIILLIGILLTGAVAAVEKLEFAALTRIVNAILEVSVNVLGGLVVFAIGLYLANLAFNLITRSNEGGQARLLAQTARIAIIAFAAAMALDRMGVAPNIVNLAFGLLLGGVAVAIGLAFGLGGRGVADELLREWLGSWKRK